MLYRHYIPMNEITIICGRTTEWHDFNKVRVKRDIPIGRWH